MKTFAAADFFLLGNSGLLSEKPSEELFIIDTVGSGDIQKAHGKKRKPLKADEILAQRSAIPAVNTRRRGSSKVTDGIIEPKIKKHKSDWVSRKELLRLRQVAREGNPTDKKEEGGLYDPWSEDTSKDGSAWDDSKFHFLEKPREKVKPSTLKRAPVSLAANGKPIPSIAVPNAGISYNPSFEAWDRVLTEEGKKEAEAEEKRLEEERELQERQRLVAEARDDDGQMRSDDESVWEGFESEYEKPEWLNRKRPERKTKAQKNKANRRKEAERRAKWESQMKKKEQQAERVKAISREVERRDKTLNEQLYQNSSSDEGDERVLRRRPFGKMP